MDSLHFIGTATTAVHARGERYPDIDAAVVHLGGTRVPRPKDPPFDEVDSHRGGACATAR